MESTQANSQVAALLSSPRSRWQIIIVAAILVVGAVVWLSMPQVVETCELIEGYKLRKNELQRIQVALSKARLNDFEIVENSILVPKSERSVYLQAVADNNALPEGLASKEDDSQNFAPFLSRIQQEQALQAEKKKQITGMVERLPFVEQAWFEMDRAKSRSSFHEDEQTAVIMIQPADELSLESLQVESIRDLITGAIAGIDRESIVVNDLNSGVSFQNGNDEQSMVGQQRTTTPALSASHRVNQQLRYEKAIREALSDFEGIEVKVTVETIEITAKKVDLHASKSPVRPNVIQIGTNGHAELSESQLAKTNLQTRLVEAVVAEVEIAEHLLPKRVSPMVRSVGPARMDAYQSKVDEFKSDIIQRILELLPKSGSANAEPVVNVRVIKEPADQTANVPPFVWLEKTLEPVGGPWGGGAILLLGVMIITYVFSGSKKSTPEHVPVSIHSEENECETEAPAGDEQSIKNEISKLLKEDPEAAAKVIKRWIRNAA